MKNLSQYIKEGLMDADLDMTQGVEVDDIISKHIRYGYKRCEWKSDGTLRIEFDGRGHISKFKQMAEKLKCTKFEFYPQITLEEVGSLNKYSISAYSNIYMKGVTSLSGCDVKCAMSVTLESQSNTKLELKNTDIETDRLKYVNCSEIIESGGNINVNKVVISTFSGKILNAANDSQYGTWSEDGMYNLVTPKTPLAETNFDPAKAFGVKSSLKHAKAFALIGYTNSESRFGSIKSPLILLFTKDKTYMNSRYTQTSPKPAGAGWTVVYSSDSNGY